jgi:hypothetical protein
MLTMSKKKPSKNPAESEALKPISVKIPPDIADALERFMSRQRIRPKLTDTLLVALQEFLIREGDYPGEGSDD